MIKLSNITKTYDNNYIFQNFNLEIEENKITSILGPSGIGKTTLLNMVGGIIPYESGNIFLPEDCCFSYVFQEPRLLNWLSISQNIEIVLKKSYDKKTREKIIKKYVNLVDLDQNINSKVKTLSGGMAQRVAIARAFAYPSNILLMDEPFVGLDIKLENELIEKFIKLWNEDKRTVIFITHSIEQAVRISDKIIILNNKPANVVKEFSSFHNNSSLNEEIKKYI